MFEDQIDIDSKVFGNVLKRNVSYGVQHVTSLLTNRDKADTPRQRHLLEIAVAIPGLRH